MYNGKSTDQWDACYASMSLGTLYWIGQFWFLLCADEASNLKLTVLYCWNSLLNCSHVTDCSVQRPLMLGIMKLLLIHYNTRRVSTMLPWQWEMNSHTVHTYPAWAVQGRTTRLNQLTLWSPCLLIFSAKYLGTPQVGSTSLFCSEIKGKKRTDTTLRACCDSFRSFRYSSC